MAGRPSEGELRSRRIKVPSTTRSESAVEIFVRPGEVVTLKTRTGALIGSFDGFRSRFAVGSSTSIQVPPGADRLGLAVNDAGEESDQPSKDDYVVDVAIKRKRKGSVGDIP